MVTSGDGPDTIYTFGGDRERFDLPPEVNVGLVDNDVWRWSVDSDVPTEGGPTSGIPTNSEWMLMLMAILLGGFGIAALHRQRMR